MPPLILSDAHANENQIKQLEIPYQSMRIQMQLINAVYCSNFLFSGITGDQEQHKGLNNSSHFLGTLELEVE